MRKAIIILPLIVLICGCASHKVAVRSDVRDSVVIKRMTVLRDSVVVRDSVKWVTRTAIRDSVVVRVDAATGKVVGRDSWHWRDTDKSRYHIADVRKMVNNSDSLSYTATLHRDSVVVPLRQEKASKGQKSGFVWFLWGMGCGMLMSVMWKFRK